jgi:hypothetical protein
VRADIFFNAFICFSVRKIFVFTILCGTFGMRRSLSSSLRSCVRNIYFLLTAPNRLACNFIADPPRLRI